MQQEDFVTFKRPPLVLFRFILC